MIKGKLALNSLTSEILYIPTISSVTSREIRTLLLNEEEKRTPCLIRVKYLKSPKSEVLAPVVQTLDSAIHRINLYPADSVIDFCNTYPLDSDLSGG